ncbi:hypothetical protein N7462_005407 [Penicillium macrosclerotiorum]|uniref:uncharacterized protein n=1 Tax=Penicillium macrosclerotiorum TaxID=303699 RepID=UPI0025496D04|nr:uncharacterized protein N7462_005407 [Penicillium macrosclerotiorum]KAJ5682242.1 hypothetical protein N7462_005407 [Penicillium macrosclerotiorum]
MEKQTHTEAPPPEQLFYYSSAHKVVICTTCRYAVQSGAIARHLKEIHHIYREKRHPYIRYTSRMKLRRPEEVKQPQSYEFPVPHLHLEQGWQCEAPGCDYLCISRKRMERHWSTVHNCKGYPTFDWSAAPLQTFFRGNMLRYFTSRESPHVWKLQAKYNLDTLDFQILRHFFHSTYKSLVMNDQTVQIWLDVVPRLAFNQDFLLRGMLACSALHLAHNEPAKRQIYTIQGCSHQDSALPSFRSAIDHISSENCDAIVAFAYLLVVYSFATDVEDPSNSFLIINDDVYSGGTGQQIILPQWLYFIRARCSILYDVWDQIQSGPASALAFAWEAQHDMGNDELPLLDYFLSIVPDDGSWTNEVIAIYQRAATTLAESFSYLARAKRESDTNNTWNTCILGTWPVRLESAFVTLMFRQRHPGTLILLAFYCIILKELEKFWYFQGRPARLITSISAMLDSKWHPYIQKAVDKVLIAGI